MSLPEVSVIIPTYNGSRFIADALRSVFAQTYLPCEIIVVDDCSTDDTLEVVEGLKAESPVPVKVIRLEKNSGGPAKPINNGVEASLCPLFAILEQDDRMRDTRIESQLGLLRRNEAATLCVGRITVRGLNEGDTSPLWGSHDQIADVIQLSGPDDDVLERGWITQKTAFQSLLVRNFAASNSTIMCFKSLWRDIGGFSSRVATCTDLEFLLRAAVHTAFCWSNEIVVEYTWREESLFRRQKDQARCETERVRFRAAYAHPRMAGIGYHHARHSRMRSAFDSLRSRQLFSAASIGFEVICGEFVRRLKSCRVT